MTTRFIEEVCSRCEAAIYDGARPTICAACEEYAEDVTPDMCPECHDWTNDGE